MTSYIGTHWLYADISFDPYNPNTARGEDYATQNWSPYIRVSASQRMCASGIIVVSDTEQYFGNVCSN
ncbi:hypothetical protein ACFYPN_22030 [Streptomyces sp. NPDC005576]|uniref:hypothetical protein n=1 Tax=Streptomyces sp. NPDC005576 TaxID=3364726 RepID=UPI0036BAB06C